MIESNYEKKLINYPEFVEYKGFIPNFAHILRPTTKPSPWRADLENVQSFG